MIVHPYYLGLLCGVALTVCVEFVVLLTAAIVNVNRGGKRK